jgi:plasmid stabilization system protein ParE
MSLPLIINPEAEADLSEAKSWYDGVRPGFGHDFIQAVEAKFETIRFMPMLFAKEFQELRIALLDRFPYQIVYRVDDDQITVVAVYHCKRDPRSWQQRA